MKNKKFKSLINRVIMIPVLIMLVFAIIITTAFMYSYKKLQDKNIDTMKGIMHQNLMYIDNINGMFFDYFSEYIVDGTKGFKTMVRINKKTPKKEYFRYQSMAMDLLQQQIQISDYVSYAFLYYKNSGLMLSRNRNQQVLLNRTVRYNIHDYLDKQCVILKVDGHNYLLMLESYQTCYNGYCLDIDSWYQDLKIDDENNYGIWYLSDMHGNSTEEIDESIANVHYFVNSDDGLVTIGIYAQRFEFVKQMKVFIIIAGISIISIVALMPLVLFWLRKRIVVPMRLMESGMKAFSKGDMDYQIPLRNASSEDEFDHMIQGFNRMVEDVNQLETDLYKSKLEEQRMKLKYISHQIRPHFILNALNLIYTYKPEEFNLVKKMVIELSRCATACQRLWRKRFSFSQN